MALAKKQAAVLLVAPCGPTALVGPLLQTVRMTGSLPFSWPSSWALLENHLPQDGSAYFNLRPSSVPLYQFSAEPFVVPMKLSAFFPHLLFVALLPTLSVALGHGAVRH